MMNYDKNKNFSELISEIDDMVIKLAPITKERITMFENKEKMEQSCYSEERLKAIKTLENLRKIYKIKVKKLIELDSEKGKCEIIKIIKKKRQIDFNIKSGFNGCYGVYESMDGDY